jgi:YidC/Oxa1 family membrane protein insertase
MSAKPCVGCNARLAPTVRSVGLARSGRPRLPASAAVHAELDAQTVSASLDALAQSFEQLRVLDTDIWLHRLVLFADVASPTATAASTSAPQDNGWLTPLVDGLEFILRLIQSQLDRLKVPYSYGWSIVALTAFVKLVTYPLTKQQVESSLAMQTLKPEIDAIKAKYGEDKDAVQRETSALYEKAGVNPLAGCLPSLATIPIFIGLYRSLTAVASQGDLDGQGFYWVPSLAGPTSIAAQKAGTGTAWLLPLVDGAPPVGWELALRYLALPVALVVAQWVSSAIVSPPVDPNADNANVQKALFAGLPLMVGWFALNVPSGLSLYYFSNTVFTSAIQIYLKKLGGANSTEFDLGPVGLGKARRTGSVAEETMDPPTFVDNAMSGAPAGTMNANGSGVSEGASVEVYNSNLETFRAVDVSNSPGVGSVASINRRCKRKRRELLEA